MTKSQILGKFYFKTEVSKPYRIFSPIIMLDRTTWKLLGK